MKFISTAKLVVLCGLASASAGAVADSLSNRVNAKADGIIRVVLRDQGLVSSDSLRAAEARRVREALVARGVRVERVVFVNEATSTVVAEYPAAQLQAVP